MKKINFSVNSWVFGPISFEELAKRAKRIGLDGLELDGEPDTIDLVHMKKVLKETGLKAISVCGTFSMEERSFSHSDEMMRRNAIEYGKKLVDMALYMETDRILLVPSMVNRLTYYVDRQTDWNHSVESIREVAEYAKENNIKVMLECVNKYEVNLVYSANDGKQMAEEIGTGNVGLVTDTFHMNLEEKDGIANAIRSAGKEFIMHQHLGDNNREVPGMGCMNWKEIFMALRDIDFEGAVSFEPLPNRLTPEEISAGMLDPDELEQNMTKSIKMLNFIMELM
ncbi:sugar phosphate isomerase/epimerase family protein [Kineothrix sp. MB12-C1]|uniref:sugar phosphate isomerase/epimerase family protein n=1 Tax=Kineothrix sp. MB12-C1 TaxID=3070215 RepID=UPI0027D216AD|nr:sugar phosphate isomerase/epimerase family protein [Kineothrix sp. MB12-C1]WMC93986.1 sugar phosphate isomerase/epimerase family protein [Kineothrix sp. MB12-C1]